MLVNGDLPYRIQEFHEKYGTVVRIGPDELSFIDPETWKEIYTSKNFLRPKQWGQRPQGVKAHNLISAPMADHDRFRKALANGFSDKAIKLQEPLITYYVDLLMKNLDCLIDDQCLEKSSAIVDMVEWTNFTTFDIASDLGWGKPFGCLESHEYHPWMTVALHYKALLFGVFLNFYPFLRVVLALITPKTAMAGFNLVMTISEKNVEDRLKHKTDRPDFMSYLMAFNETYPSMALSRSELVANSMNLIVGGSEPVSIVLAGALNCLIQSPKALDILVREIRSSFQSESDISATSTRPLSYLTAVIQETLRLCPPTSDSMRRAIPKGGANIAGHALPEGITVGVSCYAAFRATTNFTSPETFAPERWLERLDANMASPYTQDRQEAFHPFGVGPRGCIGQLLAWVEMRIILARLLWKFEIGIPKGEKALEWTSQKIYWTWNRQPVNVQLTRVESSKQGEGE